MTGVAHYLTEPDLKVAIKRAHEYLIPGGQFIIIDIANDFITMKLAYIFKKILDPATTFLYSIKSVATLLLSADFKVTGKELFRAGVFGLFVIEAEKQARNNYDPSTIRQAQDPEQRRGMSKIES